MFRMYIADVLLLLVFCCNVRFFYRFCTHSTASRTDIKKVRTIHFPLTCAGCVRAYVCVCLSVCVACHKPLNVVLGKVKFAIARPFHAILQLAHSVVNFIHGR